MMEDKVYRRSSNIVARRSGEDYILVPITDNVASMEAVYTMNETAAFIWDQIDGETSTGVIADRVAAEYGIERDISLADVRELLSELEEQNIIML